MTGNVMNLRMKQTYSRLKNKQIQVNDYIIQYE